MTLASSSSAPEDAHPKPKPRNLVVCIDGTSNRFGDENTNIVELYRRLEKSHRQLTYYNSGIGTYANQSRRSLKYFFQMFAGLADMAFAWNVDKIIMEAYQWLAENYQEGDNIYVFGFSRGAYQVRGLAGMISKVGLIHKGNDAQIPFAYELYANHGDGVWSSLPAILLEIPVAGLAIYATKFIVEDYYPLLLWATGRATMGFWLFLKIFGRSVMILLGYYFISWLSDTYFPPIVHRADMLAKEFKDAFSWPGIKVHFVGCWDTVSSIGLISRKTLPLADAVDHVDYFRHALALDEWRAKFLPEYAKVSKSIARSDSSQNASHGNSDLEKDRILEVWFPGSHSNVGGINPLGRDAQKSVHHSASLSWMLEEADRQGLLLLPCDKNNKRPNWWDENCLHFDNSMTLAWSLLEYIPLEALDYEKSWLGYRFHRHAGRLIQKDHKLHPSVFQLRNSGNMSDSGRKYTPKAVLPEAWGVTWEDLHRDYHRQYEVQSKANLLSWFSQPDELGVNHDSGDEETICSGKKQNRDLADSLEKQLKEQLKPRWMKVAEKFQEAVIGLAIAACAELLTKIWTIILETAIKRIRRLLPNPGAIYSFISKRRSKSNLDEQGNPRGLTIMDPNYALAQAALKSSDPVLASLILSGAILCHGYPQVGTMIFLALLTMVNAVWAALLALVNMISTTLLTNLLRLLVPIISAIVFVGLRWLLSLILGAYLFMSIISQVFYSISRLSSRLGLFQHQDKVEEGPEPEGRGSEESDDR